MVRFDGPDFKFGLSHQPTRRADDSQLVTVAPSQLLLQRSVSMDRISAGPHQFHQLHAKRSNQWEAALRASSAVKKRVKKRSSRAIVPSCAALDTSIWASAMLDAKFCTPAHEISMYRTVLYVIYLPM